MFLISSVKDVFDKVDKLLSGFWWAILIAAFVFLLLLIIVAACKNKRIKKLRAELDESNAELEKQRTRAKHDEMYAPVTGSENVFADTAPAVQPQSAPVKEEPKPAPAPQDKNASTTTVSTHEPIYVASPAPKPAPAPAPTPAPQKETVAAQPAPAPVPRPAPAPTPKPAPAPAKDATDFLPKETGGKFVVKYDRAKGNWVVKKDGIDRAVRRVDTKEEALVVARNLCKKYDATLVVHKKDGKFQRQ